MKIDYLEKKVREIAIKYGAEKYSVQKIMSLRGHLFHDVTIWVLINEEMYLSSISSICEIVKSERKFTEEYLLKDLIEKIELKLKKSA